MPKYHGKHSGVVGRTKKPATPVKPEPKKDAESSKPAGAGKPGAAAPAD